MRTVRIIFLLLISCSTSFAQDVKIQGPKKQNSTTTASNKRNSSNSQSNTRAKEEAKRKAEQEAREKAEQEARFNSVQYNSTTNTITYRNNSYKMVYVSGGTFTMGATSEQASDISTNEKPTHRVNLSSYYVGQTEVPQWLWSAVMGCNPSKCIGDFLPVENVSWYDCQTFANKLSSLTGKSFALPTEAQWEFAARGGNNSRGYKFSGSNDLPSVAWYTENSGHTTHKVGTKQANELGLYDMSGNVLEWCKDFYDVYSSHFVDNPEGAKSGTGRVVRGGSSGSHLYACRISSRSSSSPSTTGSSLGFRIALN